ncbi:MAG: hypothetical protein R2711_05785 [Acidimicrobiales bacterium]
MAPTGAPVDDEPRIEQIPGMTPVVDHQGRFAGYLPDAASQQALAEGEPAARLGDSELEVRAMVVVDADGEQVGWFLSGDVGFVSLEEVADPERRAEIEATWQADRAASAAASEAAAKAAGG